MTALNPDYGSRALIDADLGWSEAQRADMDACSLSSRMAEALEVYKTARFSAFVAERHEDHRSAEAFRADARATLHCFPDLLLLVEGEA